MNVLKYHFFVLLTICDSRFSIFSPKIINVEQSKIEFYLGCQNE
eukprot:UN11352